MTVPLFNLWTLRWNADRLLHGYSGYWDAPIFYPTRGAFALSEPQPPTGLVFAPFYFLTGNQVLAYNLVLLMILTLNGAAAYYLLRQLGLNAAPSLLGGVFAVALPFISNELGVLQLTVLFPIFLSLSALVAFADRRDLHSALALGGWTALALLSCEYYGLFLSLFLALAAPIFVTRRRLRLQTIGFLLAGAALAALLLLPILPAQTRLLRDFSRNQDIVEANSAQPIDYIRLNSRAWGRNLMPWLTFEGGSGQRLYPGTGLLLLAALGLVEAWRTRKRRWATYCALGACLACLLSLGFNLELAEWRPYELLRSGYPGFEQLRSPFRFGVFVQIFAVGLAGFGLATLWRWRGRIGHALAIGLVAASVLEILALPIRLYSFPHETLGQDWVQQLKNQPPGAVAVIPFPASSRPGDYQPTAIAMLQALEFDKPLANGYSGFFPPTYERLRRALQDFPGADSLNLLEEYGITYVVIDRARLSGRRLAQFPPHSTPYRFVYADEVVVIYHRIDAEPLDPRPSTSK
jgi:hypothetical protein